MSYTTVDKVVDEFYGISFDDTTVIQRFISDVERIVAQYDLTIFGQVDASSIDTLVDYRTNFHQCGDLGNSKVWKATKDGKRIIEDDVLLVSTITSVQEHKLILDDVYGNVNFSKDDYYLIEDSPRRERAERYKAASKLLTLLRSEQTAQGIEGVDVGDLSVDYGDIDMTSNTANNPFEDQFHSVVG